MGNPPFEDVSPIRNGGFPLRPVSLPEGIFIFDLESLMTHDIQLEKNHLRLKKQEIEKRSTKSFKRLL